jgi:hypothetical protein
MICEKTFSPRPPILCFSLRGGSPAQNKKVICYLSIHNGAQGKMLISEKCVTLARFKFFEVLHVQTEGHSFELIITQYGNT